MFSGLWFLCPRVIVVDEHFKDVTKDFNQCPDVLVHSVAFFVWRCKVTAACPPCCAIMYVVMQFY